MNPVVGRPVFGMYSFPWGGLDASTGDPIVLFEGDASKAYNTAYATTALEDMVFHGSIQPTRYGAVHNSIRYRAFDLSFAIGYKTGYFFRRPSLGYAELFNSWGGHSDFAKRWQNPGDEQYTDVPSMVYPVDSYRELIYRNASNNVLQGDHVRLENIRLNAAFPRLDFLGANINRLQIFAHLQNLPLVWLKNKEGIDPYYKQVARAGVQCSFGLHLAL